MCSTSECFNTTVPPVTHPICQTFQKIANQHLEMLLRELQRGNGSTLNETFEKVGEAAVDSKPTKQTWFVVVVPVIAVFGIVGNSCNLLVLTRRRMLSSLNRLEKSASYGLIALAFSDVLFCITVLPHGFIYEETSIVDSGKQYILAYRQFGIGSANLFLMISNWLIVSLSINRHIVVVYPLHARSMLTTFRTTLVIIAVYILSIVATVPHFLHRKIVPCLDLDKNIQYESQLRFEQTATRGVHLYIRWIWPVLADFIPILFLGFCNIRLIYELKKATTNRRRTAHGQTIKEPNHKVTLTLIVIVLMLLFLVTPSEVLKYIDPYESWGYTGRTIASVTNALQVVNFAFNFVLYIVVSSTFRHTFKSIFSRCPRDRADQSEMLNMLNVATTSTEKVIDTESELESNVDSIKARRTLVVTM